MRGRCLASRSGGSRSKSRRWWSKKGLSVRETEALVRRLQAPGRRRARSSAGAGDPNVQRLEQDLAEKLGARIAIQQGRGGKGKLVISYNSLDELDGILAHIQ